MSLQPKLAGEPLCIKTLSGYCIWRPCLTHLPVARPACQRLTGQRRALPAVGRIVDKLSPGSRACADGGCCLCLSLCMRWLLWFMLKLSAVSLTCQKHQHFLCRKFLMHKTYTFNSI